MENYKFIKQIGEGSYGKVQLARNPEGKDCVIKVVDTRRMNNKEKKAAMNEVKVLSSLKHPYVVRYYDSFLTAGKLCIVMAFAEKGDLYSRIKQARNGRRINPEQVLEWFTQAILALKYLHDLKILHRDLKSQNMFLTAEERLKVGDFGISRVLGGTMAFARTMIGTPYYMSPEVCSERPYSWASDIWAIGCVMFELYQLKVPFEAGSIKDLMNKIVRGSIPRASKAPTDAQQLCADMMARDSARRPSAAQILEKPIIQEQIRAMLKQQSNSSSSGGKAAMGGAVAGGFVPTSASPPLRPPIQPSVLQQVQPQQAPLRAVSPGPGMRAHSPSPHPNLPPRAASPYRRAIDGVGGPHVPHRPMPSPRIGVPGLPPKALHRDPSAPVLLNGRIARPGCASPRGPSPRLDYPPPSPKWGVPSSPRQYVAGTPRAASPAPGMRAASPGAAARGYSPRGGRGSYDPAYAGDRGVNDPADWYQRAMGLIR